ncbi:hypothetical protein H4R99_002779 [Coemansia sp. RSA 1722]|nr:hypothetical protein LPJ57_005083 [Coemansia sp. RSA 486]KAJ2226761.1 hypothetical protein IWW45_007313 [Coemansia sp. RSA 485]KAJ2602111.1 hypothetical protein H4R99_002779 [Coemansia sp. RSA 1722]
MMPMIRRNIFASGPTAIRARLMAVAASAARARLSTSTRASAPSQNHHHNNEHMMSPHELLDNMHPKRHGEVLSSMLDGELDYDTDMGAASVNNITAEKRAEANKKAEKIARDTYDDFAKRHF